jgi:PAS domain S-box-containing protein
MYAALLPALATCTVALFIASLILGRRERSPIHWVYFGFLLAIACWTGGVAWRHTHTSDAGVRSALNVLFLGVYATPPLWFWLAALYTRSPWTESRALRATSVVLPLLAYASWWTNDWHGAFASEVSHAAMQVGPVRWAGPAFWLSLVWTVGFACAGLGLLLNQAWRLRGGERARSAWLATAVLVPLALSQVYVFQLLPIHYDLTPTGLCVTLLILYRLLVREGIFEALPLARRDVIEHLRDGVLVADSEGVLIDANPAALDMLGIGPGTPVGVSLRAALVSGAVPDAEDDLAREVARAFTEGTPGALRFDTLSGRRIELSVAPVKAARGEPAGLYAVLRDHTEQHRNEQIVRQSQKLESVGVLAAGVAHEVNNPLAFIQANLGSLQVMATVIERNLDRLPEKDAEELAEIGEVLDDSLEGIARISRIVNRLRRFSRAPEDATGPVALNDVIEEAVRLARLDRHGAWEVVTRLAPDLPPIWGSRDALTQVLLNLLMNAAQAVTGRPDGRLDIESRVVEGDVVEVTVKDNGPGVPEAIRRHIFDAFFTTKPPDEGTGLGLAIAFDIAREHGGRLELSEATGPGACFRLTLPVDGPTHQGTDEGDGSNR